MHANEAGVYHQLSEANLVVILPKLVDESSGDLIFHMLRSILNVEFSKIEVNSVSPGT